MRRIRKEKPTQQKTKKQITQNVYIKLPKSFPGAFEGVPGVDLDMPDSILTSLDFKNHQKHPKQKKSVPKIKSKPFFSGPLFAYKGPLKGPYIGPDEI